MRIRYLGNSGFAFEQNGALLLIDCYNPKEHPFLLPEALPEGMAVTVLASHRHRDHFAPVLREWGHAKRVVGFDVPDPGATALSPGMHTRVNGIDITAYGSTDEGVSFHICWDDYTIFHAGDLNNWHWREESTAAYANDAEQRYLEELAHIRGGIAALDLACFPFDPRMGTDYARGAVQFAASMRPGLLIPMHFGAQFALAEAYLEELAPHTTLYTAPLTAEDWVTIPPVRHP